MTPIATGRPDTAGLASLFRASSVALVGATDRSIWSQAAFANFERIGFTGRVHPVSRKGGVVHGLPAATSCAAIGDPVDAALLMVPEGAIAEAFADMNAAGIGNAVVLTSGFAEIGAEGAAKQEALLVAARAQGVTLLGPNCLGFINYADRVPIWTTQPPMPVIKGGSIGIVSQSGATAGFIAAFAQRQGIGLSYQVSTGNEADVNVARVVDFLVDDPATKVIGLFLETVHDATLLAAAARRALAADKPIVAIKIGASETAARAAEAHTGSLVGDDRVFDAVCRQLGIIRVASIEDLVFTAALLARLGHVRDRRLGLVSISGGVCEMAADQAEAAGVAVPPLAPGTQDALRQVLPAFGTPNNPLDVTGGAMLDASIFARSLPAFGADPAIGLVACFMDVPDTEEEIAGYRGGIVRQIGAGFCRIGLSLGHAQRVVAAGDGGGQGAAGGDGDHLSRQRRAARAGCDRPRLHLGGAAGEGRPGAARRAHFGDRTAGERARHARLPWGTRRAGGAADPGAQRAGGDCSGAGAGRPGGAEDRLPRHSP